MPEMTPLIRLLVLSDVHFGELADWSHLGNNSESEANVGEVIEPVIEALREHSLDVDVLILPGDLTSRGYPMEFENCGKIVKELASRLELNSESVMVTFGNHDVDWRICQLREHPPEKNKAVDPHYKSVAASVGGLMMGELARFDENGPFAGCGMGVQNGVQIFVLNSSLKSFDDEALKHGAITEEQFDWFKKTLEEKVFDGPRILVIHHHLFDMPYPTQHWDISKTEESPEIVALLGEHKVSLVIHGHRHHPSLVTQKLDASVSSVTFFCAGSFGVGAAERNGGTLPNTFHHITVGQDDASEVQGIVKSFQRRISGRWEPMVNEEANLDSHQWFSSDFTDIEQNQAIELLVNNAESATQTGAKYQLPEHNDLSLCLRVMRKQRLEERLTEKFSAGGFEMFGSYEGVNQKVAVFKKEED